MYLSPSALGLLCKQYKRERANIYNNGRWRQKKTGTRTLYSVTKEMFSKKFVIKSENINANSYWKKACAITDVKLCNT